MPREIMFACPGAEAGENFESQELGMVVNWTCKSQKLVP